MEPLTVILCIAGIALGVGVICYVLLRTPKAPAALPTSDIVLGDEVVDADAPTAEAADAPTAEEDK